jgi:3-phenylpropionate/trans-cinnamate dioxygenase ferredoxin subunit
VAKAAVADGAATRVEAGGSALCVIRIGDDFYALGDRCSHADVSLSEGDIDPEELTVECWKHGSTFSLTDGKPQCLPATKPVPTYDVRSEGDEIVVIVK